jgi:hypothetical protein
MPCDQDQTIVGHQHLHFSLSTRNGAMGFQWAGYAAVGFVWHGADWDSIVNYQRSTLLNSWIFFSKLVPALTEIKSGLRTDATILKCCGDV